MENSSFGEGIAYIQALESETQPDGSEQVIDTLKEDDAFLFKKFPVDIAL